MINMVMEDGALIVKVTIDRLMKVSNMDETPSNHHKEIRDTFSEQVIRRMHLIIMDNLTSKGFLTNPLKTYEKNIIKIPPQISIL